MGGTEKIEARLDEKINKRPTLTARRLVRPVEQVRTIAAHPLTVALPSKNEPVFRAALAPKVRLTS
jgi:hypothetical protein